MPAVAWRPSPTALSRPCLIEAMVEHDGLTLLDKDPEGPVPPRHVALVEMPEADPAQAFARRRVDAVTSVIAPTAPAAAGIVIEHGNRTHPEQR